MKGRFLIGLLISIVTLGIAVYAQARDKDDANNEDESILACYRFDPLFTNERYKLGINAHSSLSEEEEEKNFNHPRQFVFSVHGKHVGSCGFGTVRPVVGTLITTVPLGQPWQARLGLESFNTTGMPNFCRDVEISCQAGDTEGFPPKTWNCFGQNKFDVEFEVQLIKVDENKDERCSVFEDEQYVGASDDEETSGLMGRPPSSEGR